MVEDPVTKRLQPRDYVDTLERRVAHLEECLSRKEHESPTVRTQSQASPDAYQPQQLQTNDDAADNTTFAESVATLGLNAGGVERRYLGHSSAFSFSKIISSSLLKGAPLQRPSGPTEPLPDDAQQFPSLLPDGPSARILSNAYFHSIQQQYPFMHEGTFRNWESNLLDTTRELTQADYVQLFFLYAIYAIGAILLPNSGHNAKRLFTSAQLYIDHVLPLDNLESIQALLCCAVYSLRAAEGPSIWKLSGLALRQCIDLGYHRTASRYGATTNPMRLQMQRRVFWTAFTIDCSQSTTLGRPLGVPVHEVNAEYPFDIDDDQITETGLLSEPRSCHFSPPTSMSVAIRVFRSRYLWARIHTELLSDMAAEFPGREERITKMRAEVEEWSATSPPVPAHSRNALVLFGCEDWFSTNYSFSILLLYRPYLVDTSSTPPDQVFLDCFAAASNVCRCYRRQFVGRSVGYTWQALHFLFLAGLTYLHCLWTSAAVRNSARHDQISSTCSDCTMLLTVMAERWSAVGPYRDLFEALASRTMTMLVERNNSTASSHGSSNGHANDSDDLDWSQWLADIADTRGMSNTVDKLLMGLMSDST